MTPPAGGDDPVDPPAGGDDEPTNPSGTLAVVDTPVVGTAYKFGLVHGGYSNATVFFNGENWNNYSYYIAYSEVATDAVDVYLEAVDGVDGAYRPYSRK